MATLLQIPQFLDENGDPLDSGKLYFYQAGTTTPKDTWKDQGEGTVSPNPVILDSEGRVGDSQNGVWLRGSYKLVVKDKNDVELSVSTYDDLNLYDQIDFTGLNATVADLNSTVTTALLKNSTYTISTDDRNKLILCDTTTASFDINLPTAVAAGNKFRIYIKKTDLTTNTVTIKTPGSETIDGRTDFVLAEYNDLIAIQCDGSNWKIISTNLRRNVDTISAVEAVDLSAENRVYLANASGGAFAVNLPAVATLGKGFKVLVKKTDSSSNAVTVTPNGAETIDGNPTFALIEQYDALEIITNGTNWFILNDFVSELSAGLPRGYLSGIAVTQDSGDTQHDINFGVGAARDVDNSVNMLINTALIKKIDASWAEGNNQGGFAASGSLAPDTWYQLFLIAKPDGTTDAGFDDSITATNLLAAAAGYTKYRRVGSVLTDGSSNITDYKFQDFNGMRQFLWQTVATPSAITVSSGTSADITLRVPLDIESNAILNCVLDGVGYNMGIYIHTKDTADQATQFALETVGYDDTAADSPTIHNDIIVKTDTAQKIRYTSAHTSGSVSLYVNTIGWYDNTSI